MTNPSSENNQSGYTLIIASGVFLVIIALLWALLTVFPSFSGGITAKESALTDLGNIIVVFSFVALALQSSLGVFVSNFRGAKRSRKNRRVNNLRQEIAEIKNLIKPVPVATTDDSAPDASDLSSQSSQATNPVVTLDAEELAEKKRELKDFKAQLETAEDDLEKYRDGTKAIVARLSLLAGIVISLAGIRILQSFTDVALVGKQLSLFNAIDVLLTGGLLAGGSAGVHRLTKVYEEVTDVKKQVSQ